jgi:exosortase
LTSGSAGREHEPAADAPPAWVWFAAGALFLALFWPILAVRWHTYLETPRYSHCVLLPAVSALFVWDRWSAIRALPRRVSPAGIAALAAAVLLFLYGRKVHTNVVQHAAMLAALAAVVWGLAGRAVLAALAFPLGYLALMQPLPKTVDDAITLPLQSVATGIAETFFAALGWIVVRDGNILQLPRVKLLVEEGCSGVHSLYALFALALAWVAFVERPVWMRVALVAASVPVAVLANAIRVSATGVLAYKVDPSYAQGVSHQTAGMIVFAIGLALLLGIDWCLRPDPPESAPAANDAAA